MPPAIAVLGPIMREREDVVGGLANGVQDAAVLDREGLGELLGEVRGRQRHAPDIWVGQRPESSRLGTRAVSPARSVEPSPSLRRTARRSYEIPASQESQERHGFRFSRAAGVRGRPKALPLLVPLALALATPARTRSTIMLRSNSANTPII